jgi:hypothetical protein
MLEGTASIELILLDRDRRLSEVPSLSGNRRWKTLSKEVGRFADDLASQIETAPLQPLSKTEFAQTVML